jgi:Ricin-type beta-trefoil lectin domain-like
MVRRILGSRAGFTAYAVILAGVASMYLSVPASAVQVVHPAAQAGRAPAATRPAALPDASAASAVLLNVFNLECLYGGLGHGNVTLGTCYQGPDEWEFPPYPGDSSGGFYIKNASNGKCLDGREGNGNVTLWPCAQDGTHEDWRTPQIGSGVGLQDQFNKECLDGREGFANVNLWTCGIGVDGTHEDWVF